MAAIPPIALVGFCLGKHSTDILTQLVTPPPLEGVLLVRLTAFRLTRMLETDVLRHYESSWTMIGTDQEGGWVCRCVGLFVCSYMCCGNEVDTMM